MKKIKLIPIFTMSIFALAWYFFSSQVPLTVEVTKLRVVDSFSIVMGDGRDHLFVFESIDCAFCAKLHPEFSKLKNATVHLFPLPGHSPKAVELSKAVWCAADRPRAWREAFDNITPANSSQCAGDALERNLVLAKSLGLQSTPSIVFGNGNVSVGYLDGEKLQAKLLEMRQDH
ncbi:DsbC family protein [Rugamonas sp. A1-17]|nr:DsbC family protein [Rugamonas sp. A1-17]